MKPLTILKWPGRLAALVLLAGLVLSGCEVPIAAPTAPEATPVSTAGPTATPTATPLPTLPPTDTPLPVPTATPSPLAPLGLRKVWTWMADDIIEAMIARDLDGDGRPEIAIASYDRWVYLLDASAQVRWSYDTGGSVFSLDAADLNGDGKQELLAGSEDGTLRALDIDGNLLWQAPLGGRVTTVKALDLEGNGQLEVVAGFRPNGLAALKADGTEIWRIDLPGAPSDLLLKDTVEDRAVYVSTEEGSVLAIDPNGLTTWQHNSDDYIRGLAPSDGGPLAGARDGILRRYGPDGQPVWEQNLSGPIASTAASGLEQGPAFLAGVGGQQSGLTALDSNGTPVWHTSTEHGVWALAFPDLEKDGRREIVAGTDGGEVVILDSYGRIRGDTWVPFRVHGLVTVDLDGDGQEEVLARASHHLYAFAGTPQGEAGEQQPFVSTLAEWPADAPLQPVADGQISLLAVGDIMLGRAVEERALVYGPDYPFAALAPLLREGDITTGNMEGTLADGGAPLQKTYTFRAKPSLATGLRDSGFAVMSLANNHALDFGQEGLDQTAAALNQVGIQTIGAGANAYDPVFLDVKGIRIAVLARTAAIASQDGVAWANPDELRQAVAAAREQADLVVVHLHAGVEYATVTDETQRALAQAAADGGATLVIGHHSHSPQPVEWIGQTLVAYSLGDFVFDIDDNDIARDAAVLRVLLSKQGIESAEWIPVRIVDDVQPRPRVGSNGQPTVEPVYVNPEAALPAPPTPRPAYDVSAEVAPYSCTVSAVDRVTFPNTTADSLQELVFQVFPASQPDVLQIDGIEGSTPAGTFSPEPRLEGMMLHVALPAPLAPGETANLTISYTLQLPPPVDYFPESNLSCTQDTVVLGFWYPQLVPYRPGQGWELWAPVPAGDPAVLGVADQTVEVSAPSDYQVIGGGDREESGGNTRLHMDAARDIALVVGARYEKAEQEVDGVTLTSFFHPEHRAGGEAALNAVAQALPLFEERYGPYPLRSFALVEADMQSGLEHSGMTIIGSSFYDSYSGAPLELAVRVPVHEFAHQWWFGTVGTDQVFEPWIDEGLAQYSEVLFYEKYYPDLVASWWAAYGQPRWGPPSLNSSVYDFTDSRSLLTGLYGQADTFYQALRNTLGDDSFFAVLQAFYRENAFKLAQGKDLIALAQASAGNNLQPLLDQFFFAVNQ